MEFLNSSIDIICLMSSLSEFQSFAASYLMVSSPQVVVLGSGKLGTLFPLKKYLELQRENSFFYDTQRQVSF